MEFLWFALPVIFVWMIFSVISQGKEQSNIAQTIDDSISKNFPGFVTSRKLLKFIGTAQKPEGLLVDNTSQQVVLIKEGIMRLYPFSRLLECETVVDGKTKIKTSRASQAANAVVLGALTGGVGAVVGALTAKKEEVKEIKKVTLKIVVSDLENPIYTIDFGRAVHEAEYWADILSVIIAHGGQR